MKSVEEVLLNRRSYRNYSDKVDTYKIKAAIKVAQRTATSINGQHVSVILVTDQEKLNKLSEINWGQKHIQEASAFLIFVADFNRSEAVMTEKMTVQNNIESILVGSIDAALLAQSVELVLQSNDLATCMIGGIRAGMKEICELFNITGKALPVLGMTVGVETIKNSFEDIRPRVDLDSFLFDEKYDKQKVCDGAIKYNEDLNSWWEARGVKDHRSYAQSMTSFYGKDYGSDGLRKIQELGFLGDYIER